MKHQDTATFLKKLQDSIQDATLVRITLGKSQTKEGAEKIFIRPVELSGIKLQFLSRFPTQDITKNYPVQNSLQRISELLGNAYYSATLYTTIADYEWVCNKKGEPRLIEKKPSHNMSHLSHDRSKKAYLDTTAPYLEKLGLVTLKGDIVKGKERKFRQIEKFLETFESLARETHLGSLDTFHIVDMGSGMGYLTFALYGYLEKAYPGKASITGVEARKELVDACNAIADEASFERLRFAQGRIGECEVGEIDVLIALHACDTATDDALYQAIRAEAKIILSVPCCHKELRSQIGAGNAWKNVLDFGIMSERQSEMVTDGIRALLLEASGYKAHISEFISADHTAKNVLLTGVWKGENPKKLQLLQEIQDIQTFFQIREQKLKKLLFSP